MLNTEFKVDLALYLGELQNSTVKTLADVIKFNDLHSDVEMPPKECCQETLIDSVQTNGLSDPICASVPSLSLICV